MKGLALPALLALACADGSAGPTDLVPDPVPGPGLHARTLSSGGRDRSYLLHVPAGWAPGARLPLVLAFHGAASDPQNLRAVSGLSAVADEHDVLVAFPAAAVGDWNTGCLECGSNAVIDDVDDLGFVRDLVDRIAADAGVERDRVYAIGISNGALFVHSLACAARETIAAAASVAATMIAPEHVPACRTGPPMPIAFFLGSEDSFFPPQGKLAGNDVVHVRLLSIAESVATWVARNGCGDSPATSDLPDLADDGTTVRLTRYEECAGGTEIAYWSIVGGGHTWPGSAAPSGGLLGRTTLDLSASEAAIRFFLDHHR